MDPWYKVVTPREEVRGGPVLQPRRVRHRPSPGRERDRPQGLPGPGAVLLENLLHPGPDGAHGDRTPPPLGTDREHRTRPLPGNPVRRGQDSHPDGPLPPGQGRAASRRPQRGSGCPENLRSDRSRPGARRHIRRERVGPRRREGDSLDRRHPSDLGSKGVRNPGSRLQERGPPEPKPWATSSGKRTLPS